MLDDLPVFPSYLSILDKPQNSGFRSLFVI
jgi:hypothetical protein